MVFSGACSSQLCLLAGVNKEKTDSNGSEGTYDEGNEVNSKVRKTGVASTRLVMLLVLY